jgi:hypothetical protein
MKIRSTGAVMRQDAASQPAAFRQDEASAQPTAQQTVVLLKLDGKEYVQGSAAHVNALDSKIEKLVQDCAAKDAELGATKAKLDAAEAQAKATPGVEALVAAELTFRADMLPLLPKDYKFDGKSRDDVRYDAVGAETAAKIRALPEGQREGYLVAKLDERRAAADRPTHAPAPGTVVKADAATKFDPYAKFKEAHAASYGVSK